MCVVQGRLTGHYGVERPDGLGVVRVVCARRLGRVLQRSSQMGRKKYRDEEGEEGYGVGRGW